MLRGEGYEVVGVSVAGPPPLGRVHLELQPGVTALYGLNGSGKSRLLRALQEALTGESPRHGGVVNREVAVAIDPSVVNQRSPKGWLASAKTAADRAVVSSVADRSVGGGSDDLWVHLSSPPVCLRDALQAMADAALWIDPQDLSIEVASSGTVVVSTDPRGARLQVAATSETIITVGPEDILWDSVEIADSAAAAVLGIEIEPIRPGLVNRLDLMSLVADRCLDPAAVRDIEAGEVGYQGHRPTWSPIPFGKGDTLDSMPVEVFGERLTVDTLRERTLDAVTALAKKVISIATDEEVELTSDATETVADIERRANRFTSLLLRDAPTLRLRVGTPDEWLVAAAPRWEALDGVTANWIAISELSGAQRRWASLAVDLAIAEAQSNGRPFVLLLDEPEAGLHRAAERHLATGLKQLAVELRDAAIVVASHSPEFLADPGVRVMHIQRAHRGMTIATGATIDLNDAIEAERAMSDLGLTRSDLLHLARVVVVVEGSHDVAVVRSVGEQELALDQAFVAKMLGAKNASAVLDAQVLMSMSDAMVLVVVDAIAAQKLEPIWLRVQASATAGDHAEARHAISQLHRLDAVEANWLAELAERTIAVGRLDRLHLTSLSKADILQYLDPVEFGLDEPWSALTKQWRAVPREHRPKFKDWLRKEKKARIGVKQVERAALALRSRPRDLDKLFARIHELSMHPR